MEYSKQPPIGSPRCNPPASYHSPFLRSRHSDTTIRQARPQRNKKDHSISTMPCMFHWVTLAKPLNDPFDNTPLIQNWEQAANSLLQKVIRTSSGLKVYLLSIR